MSAAGALISTATSWTRPSWLARDWFTIPSTPAIPSSAWPPNVSVVRAAAATGYLLPPASRADRAAGAVVMRSPAANRDHTCWLAAVAGGVHGRSAAAGAPSTVSGLPFTVIRAPSMGSTARTWLSFLILARSAGVTPPGTAAMTSGTTRRGTAAPAAEAALGEALPAAEALAAGAVPAATPTRGARPRQAQRRRDVARAGQAGGARRGGRGGPRRARADPFAGPWQPLNAAIQLATATLTATRPPPMTAGHAPGRMVSCFTVT